MYLYHTVLCMYNTYIQSTEYNLRRQAGGPPRITYPQSRVKVVTYYRRLIHTYIEYIVRVQKVGRIAPGDMAGGNQGFVLKFLTQTTQYIHV